MRFGVEVVPGARSKRMSLLVAHGWNIELGAGRDSSRVSTAFGLGTHERVGDCTCTLLGPEGPGRLLLRGWLDLDSPRSFFHAWVCGGGIPPVF